MPCACFTDRTNETTIMAEKEKFNEIIASSAPTLVDFYATWCGPCQAMHPILEELKTKIGDKARILKIDVDQNPELAAAYGVQSIPTMIVFSGGAERTRFVGARRLPDLEAAINEAAGA